MEDSAGLFISCRLLNWQTIQERVYYFFLCQENEAGAYLKLILAQFSVATQAFLSIHCLQLPCISYVSSTGTASH